MGLTFPGTGMQVDKLWENADASASFPAQKVSLDLSGYDAIFVECTLQRNYSQRKCELVRVGSIVSMLVFNKDDLIPGGFRTVTVASDGVTFGAGYYYAWDQQKYVENDIGAVPTVIYGVRF